MENAIPFIVGVLLGLMIGIGLAHAWIQLEDPTEADHGLRR